VRTKRYRPDLELIDIASLRASAKAGIPARNASQGNIALKMLLVSPRRSHPKFVIEYPSQPSARARSLDALLNMTSHRRAPGLCRCFIFRRLKSYLSGAYWDFEMRRRENFC